MFRSATQLVNTMVFVSIVISKILHLVMAVFTLCVHSSSHSESKLSIACDSDSVNVTLVLSVTYPFNLQQKPFAAVPLCNSSSQVTGVTGGHVTMTGDYSLSAAMFTAVSVIASLHNIVIVTIYVYAAHWFEIYDTAMMLDCACELVCALLWPIVSCTWAASLSAISMATDPDEPWLPATLTECNTFPCTTLQHPNLASAYTALIFGFLCSLLWPLTAYQLFRKTVWYPRWKQFNFRLCLSRTLARVRGTPCPQPALDESQCHLSHLGDNHVTQYTRRQQRRQRSSSTNINRASASRQPRPSLLLQTVNNHLYGEGQWQTGD